MNTSALSFLLFGAIVMTYAIVITVVDGEDPLWLLLDGGVLLGAFFIALGREDAEAQRRPLARVVQAPRPPVPFWAEQDLAHTPEPQPKATPEPTALPARRLHLSRAVAWWVTTRMARPAAPAPYRTPPPRIRPEEPSAPPVAYSRPPARHRRTGGPR